MRTSSACNWTATWFVIHYGGIMWLCIIIVVCICVWKVNSYMEEKQVGSLMRTFPLFPLELWQICEHKRKWEPLGAISVKVSWSKWHVARGQTETSINHLFLIQGNSEQVLFLNNKILDFIPRICLLSK